MLQNRRYLAWSLLPLLLTAPLYYLTRSNPAMPRIPAGVSSGKLVTTRVPAGVEPRQWWLDHYAEVTPPWISSSGFIARDMIQHLMRDKVELALGTKSSAKLALGKMRITNMEGMLHSFVIPIVLGYMHGDYYFAGGHKVRKFPTHHGMQMARPVLISAFIQPDFEYENVMWRLCSPESQSQSHTHEQSQPQTSAFKSADDVDRFDERLRAATRSNLFKSHHSSSSHAAHHGAPSQHGETLDSKEAFSLLQRTITDAVNPRAALRGYSVLVPRPGSKPRPLSLEMLFLVMLEQARNELLALEYICEGVGYVYTFDPAVIFRQALGPIGAKLMYHVHAAALRQLSTETELREMKVFAFNDFANPEAVGLYKEALRGQPCGVTAKSRLFDAETSHYAPHHNVSGAMLVIHNNSDAFGQNIEFESGGGSMDAVIGQYSSASASLLRKRSDLVSERRLLFWPRPTH